MSKKKRKKNNTLADQKLQMAQYKNDFFQRLCNVCIAIDSIEFYHMIPKELKEHIYNFRGTSLRIKGRKGLRIKRSFMEYLDSNLKWALNESQMELIPGSGRTISFADYFRIFLTLGMILKENYFHFKGNERFNACLDRKDELIDKYIYDLNLFMFNTIFYANDYRDEFLYVGQARIFFDGMDEEPKMSSINLSNNSSIKNMVRTGRLTNLQLRQELEIDILPLETRIFIFDGEARSAIRLGVVDILCKKGKENSFTPIFIPLKKLDHNNSFGDLPIPVYIQKHAINRMIERLYRLPSELIEGLIYSIIYLEIEDIGDNKYRITYYLQKLKAGYVIASYIEGCLVIRTFLFLTNSGTPEGKLLEEQTGLQRADKEHLALDKLGSLLKSNLLENEEVCQLLINAGCGSILELCKKGSDFDYEEWLSYEPKNKKFRPESVSEYINKKKDDDYLQF